MSLPIKYNDDEILYSREDLNDGVSSDVADKIKIIKSLPYIEDSNDNEYVVKVFKYEFSSYEIMTEEKINDEYTSLSDHSSGIEQLSFNI